MKKMYRNIFHRPTYTHIKLTVVTVTLNLYCFKLYQVQTEGFLCVEILICVLSIEIYTFFSGNFQITDGMHILLFRDDFFFLCVVIPFFLFTEMKK